ncbi:hypothetical protein FPE01S_04_01630 [Flavihumibacter petaseus NBRC 106054]|uniref:Glycosyltransferase RgtA/B/C/D-like domain-containing protein n=2 Tax=Flavihumibacter TaxID=1004301 RepID=A0A0E9N6F1_9BACT|nr:hypothetical protein FPE01S_04_01630 [Flavihumibacter petaseus NBRC 106054]
MILLIYGLILKFPLFLHRPAPLRQLEDNYLYKLILDGLRPFAGESGFVYGLLAFLLLYLQANLLNRVANSIKLFPKPNFLVGMSFLLVSSLLPEWNQFSSTLIVNFLLIWIFYGITTWYNSPRPLSAIFNTCLLLGVLPLFYSPCVAYIVLLILAIIITRPLRVGEWVVAAVGFLAPYYFLFIILYLANNLRPYDLVPKVSFHLPRLPASLWITFGILLLVVPFLIGGWFVQDNLNKMLIQVRKCWSLVLVVLLVGLLIILVNPGDNYQHWFLSSIPLTSFHAATYYYPQKRTFPLVLHWVIFAFAIAANYFG